jgi:hypothetical protein
LFEISASLSPASETDRNQPVFRFAGPAAIKLGDVTDATESFYARLRRRGQRQSSGRAEGERRRPSAQLRER